jgi:hypothetical protein
MADPTPSQKIDDRIAELGDWRGERLARIRDLIHDAVPDVEETWKWRGVPVWERDGIICTGESYADYLKLTFMKGASIEDPDGLFNTGLEGNARRGIDIHEDDELDEDAFRALVQRVVAKNRS